MAMKSVEELDEDPAKWCGISAVHDAHEWERVLRDTEVVVIERCRGRWPGHPNPECDPTRPEQGTVYGIRPHMPMTTEQAKHRRELMEVYALEGVFDRSHVDPDEHRAAVLAELAATGRPAPERPEDDEGKWDNPLDPDSYGRIAEERYDDRYWGDE